MFKILNKDDIKTFVKKNFINVLNNIIIKNSSKVFIENKNAKTIVSNNTKKQEIHQKRIIKSYIIPSLYLIYSFIYIRINEKIFYFISRPTYISCQFYIFIVVWLILK